MSKTWKAPASAREAARRALEVRASKPPSQRGMIDTGLARARQLVNNEDFTENDIRTMYAWFRRHAVDKQGSTWGEQGKGWQAWHGWGGDAAFSWVSRLVRQFDKQATKALAIQHEYDIKRDNEPENPELWQRAIAEAKKRFKVYPSAYANAWASRWYKQRGGKWRSSTKDLREWFDEDWVDISRPIRENGKIVGYQKCGRSDTENADDYPKCLPKAKAMKLTDEERKRLIARKRRKGLPKDGKPTMTSSETKTLRVRSYYRNGKFVREYQKRQPQTMRKKIIPGTVEDAKVPDHVAYPALYKRARRLARQKYNIWPSRYGSQYMVSLYEKMVKQQGGKPYRA